MGATGFVAYTAVRRRWVRVVALSVLVGVLGGVATAAVLGAERSRTSLDRFIADTNAADARIFVAGSIGVAAVPVVPVLVLVLLLLEVVVLAEAASLIPARSAAQVRPAAMLRTE